MNVQKQLDRKKWFTALFIVCVILAYTLWYLTFNPASILLFSVTAIIALSFMAIFTVSTKRKQQLIKRAIDHNTIKEPTQMFFTLRNVALAIITIGILVFPVAVRFLPPQNLAYFVIAFVATQLVAGAVFAIALVKISRMWGLVFLVILAISAVIGLVAALASHLKG